MDGVTIQDFCFNMRCSLFGLQSVLRGKLKQHKEMQMFRKGTHLFELLTSKGLKSNMLLLES